jgi:hypothetical protein
MLESRDCCGSTPPCWPTSRSLLSHRARALITRCSADNNEILSGNSLVLARSQACFTTTGQANTGRVAPLLRLCNGRSFFFTGHQRGLSQSRSRIGHSNAPHERPVHICDITRLCGICLVAPVDSRVFVPVAFVAPEMSTLTKLDYDSNDWLIRAK